MDSHHLLGDSALAIVDAHDDAGTLAMEPDGTLFSLSFDWRKLQVKVLLERAPDQSSNLTVSSDLGLLPYSAEGPQRRINVLAVLNATRNGYPLRFYVSDVNRLKFMARATFSTPATAPQVISEVAALLVQARPYLDIISMMQVTRAQFVCGSEKTCPG